MNVFPDVITRYWHCYPQQRSAIWTSIKELFLLPKFDNSSPSVTRDRDLSKSSDYQVMRSLPPEAEYPMELFKTFVRYFILFFHQMIALQNL